MQLQKRKHATNVVNSSDIIKEEKVTHDFDPMEGPAPKKQRVNNNDNNIGMDDDVEIVEDNEAQNEINKNVDARHGKESVWISCFLKPKVKPANYVFVNFKPINDRDLPKKVKIFARINQNGEIEICVQNLGSLKMELSMEAHLWDRPIDETQSIGSRMFKLESYEWTILAKFKSENIRFLNRSLENGFDLRIHFKPHF